jgi:TPR repeat protein
MSYVNLLNVPYPQQAPTAVNFNNAHLRGAVGSNASLLSNKQTLEMYRINAKKTNDPAVQYEFAIFMITAAQEAAAAVANGVSPAAPGDRDLDSPHVNNGPTAASVAELLKEGKSILQKLSDRGYPFAQYYLGDGYASGLFSKGKEDWDRAFSLFVAAGKHGHAESCYRTALCYEYGWGCRKDPAKAEQFYRQAAARGHPGAMTRLGKACLLGDMGLFNRQREGLKWLRRAAEAADGQYNNAPYELAILHESGYLDYVFADEAYAAQLFTQAADLGHVEAAYRLGDAYEHGKISLPQDGGLSIHFYNSAAEKGHAHSMLALCAWYLVGAEPVIQKDENEAYEWAKAAAEQGV